MCPRNGSGLYDRSDGSFTGETVWENNRDAAINIVVSAHDAHDQDIADALTASLAKDGQTTPTANLPMGGYRHTNCGVATARSDYARTSQVQDNAFAYATCSSASNVYTLTLSPAVTAYATGMEVSFKADATSSGAITVKLNALTAKKLYLGGGTIQASGTDLRSGKYYRVAYDSALDGAAGGFVLLGEGRAMQGMSPSPTLGAGGSMTYGTTTVTYADFQLDGDLVTVQAKFTGTTGGSASDHVTMTLPYTAAAIDQTCGAAVITDSTSVGGHVQVASGASVAKFYKNDRSNYGLGAGRAVEATFTYRRA